jgi:hypothetical protein
MLMVYVRLRHVRPAGRSVVEEEMLNSSRENIGSDLSAHIKVRGVEARFEG